MTSNTLTSNEFLTTRIYGDLSTHGWTGRAGETYSGNMYVANDLRIAGNVFIPNNTFYIGNDLDVGGNIILSGNLVDYNGNNLLNPVSSSIIPAGTNQGDFLSWDGTAWSVADSSICIGNQAGNIDATNLSVGIGNQAGGGQSLYAVSIGHQSGINAQGPQCVAIGAQSGANNQLLNAIAIGSQAGFETQGHNCVAIGPRAGYKGQGENSVCIGAYAGQTNQASNSIYINGSGQHMTGTTPYSCYINPIRDSRTGTGNMTFYDTTTNELFGNSNFTCDALGGITLSGALHASNAILASSVKCSGMQCTTSPLISSNTNMLERQSGGYFVCWGTSSFSITLPNPGNQTQCYYLFFLSVGPPPTGPLPYINFYPPSGKILYGNLINTLTGVAISNAAGCTLSNLSVGNGPTYNLIIALWDYSNWALLKIS